MAGSVAVLAPAKVNLCLSVGNVRSDGFHEVETVMHTLSLADDVTVTPADKLSIACQPSVGVADERNSAYRAALAFGLAFDVPVEVHIDIVKRIPHEAGLGGGSSDAAAVIAALALLGGFERTDERCIQAARSIGADVPFFLYGACAHLAGRGDELVATLPPVAAPVVLVRPEAPVPTAAAYAAFDAYPQPRPSPHTAIAALNAGDTAALAASLANNLEVAAGTIAPEITPVLTWLAEQPGVLGSLLAGSGSAAFALTDSPESADRIRAAASESGWWSCASGLSPEGMTAIVEGSR